MELLLTIRDFITQTIYILTMLALIVFFLAVNVQALAEWKKDFTNNK